MDDPTLGPCSADAITRDVGITYNLMDERCNGQWAFAAYKHPTIPNPDSTTLFRWSAGRWNVYSHFPAHMCLQEAIIDGVPEEYATGMFTDCGSRTPRRHPEDDYEPDEVKLGTNGQPWGYVGSSGIPGAVWTQHRGYVSMKHPLCTNQEILIVESVVMNGSDPQVAVAEALDRHPGAEYAYPGSCSSLRKAVDDRPIYPIYYNFGYNTEALCAAKARLGGNGRVLNHNSDFSDPCLK
ncbi:hypothetical protein C1Y63_11685 [Corynebacterium sp. 13CS0277]|nr:hypothetical protein C1Y63_11685 [Corynebacterium sp. 13CS0277]